MGWLAVGGSAQAGVIRPRLSGLGGQASVVGLGGQASGQASMVRRLPF